MFGISWACLVTGGKGGQTLLFALRALAVIAASIVVLIIGFLVFEASHALRSIGVWRFFSDPSWHPAEGSYNLSPMLWGTLFATFGAMLLAAPLGILSAIFCQFYAPRWLASIYLRLIELLGGIPSVVYGFWGLVVLVPLIARWQPPGPSLLAGVLILALMILPTIALMANAALSRIPASYTQAASALGLSRWATVRSIALPHARGGLLTAIILGTGRAIGETMAILMVCGNVVQTPKSIFAPIRTLTSNIALEMAYALGNHRSALFVSGLLLAVLVVVLLSAAEVIARGRVYG